MKKKYGFIAALTVLATALTYTAPASAAWVTIDDSNPTTMTISASDFEGGFYVNGNLLTMGLFASASVTIPDGIYHLSGNWIDLGQTQNAQVGLQFAHPSNPGFMTSGVIFGANSDGFMAQLNGFTGGYLNPTQYMPANGPTFAQNGQTAVTYAPYLGVGFISENATATPEPATMLLLGSGLAGLIGARRKKKAQA